MPKHLITQLVFIILHVQMNTFTAFIKLIRLPNLLIVALTQYVMRYAIINGILMSIPNGIEIELLMSDLDFFLLSLSTVMIAAAGYIINDYFDVKVDRVNRPGTIIVGKYIKRRIAMGAHIVISSIAVLIGGYLAYQLGNYKLVSIQVLSVGALWYYSTVFKKQVLVGNVIVALLAAMVPFVAGLYELILQHASVDSTVNSLLFQIGSNASFEEVRFDFLQVLSNCMVWILGFALFAFLSTMVREIIKDIEDYEGDKKYYSNTLVVVYGKRVAAIVAQVFGVIMIALIGYLQYQQLMNKDMGSFMYFLFTVQLPMAYVVYKLQTDTQKEDFSKLSKYTKLIMLSGIVYSLYFYYTTINA